MLIFHVGDEFCGGKNGRELVWSVQKVSREREKTFAVRDNNSCDLVKWGLYNGIVY